MTQAKWTTFWMVLAIYKMVESVTDIVLSWFPFYTETKTIIVLWFTITKTSGTTYLFQRYIKRLIDLHESQIDNVIENSQKKALRLSILFSKVLLQVVVNTVINFSRRVQNNMAVSSSSSRPTLSVSSPTCRTRTKRLLENGNRKIIKKDKPTSDSEVEIQDEDYADEEVKLVQDSSKKIETVNEMRRAEKIIQILGPSDVTGSNQKQNAIKDEQNLKGGNGFDVVKSVDTSTSTSQVKIGGSEKLEEEETVKSSLLNHVSSDGLRRRSSFTALNVASVSKRP